MGIRICPKCNGKVSTSRNVCIHCGYVFPSSKKCPDCGEAVDINVMECPVCGYLFNKASLVNESLNDVKKTVIEEQKKTNVAKPEIVVETDEISTETEENNLEIEKEKVEEHNETREVVEKDSNGNDNKIIALSDDVILTTSAYEAEEESTKSSVECPYCGSKSLMSIGIEYYMCDTCKGKFLNTSGGGFTSPYVRTSKMSETVDSGKGVTENSISKNAIEVTHIDAKEQSEENLDGNVDAVSGLRKKPKDDEKYFEKPKVKEHKEKVSGSSGSNKKLWIIITSIVAGLAVIFGILTGTVFVPKSHYDNALSLLNSDVNKSIEIFDNLSWGDSSNQACFARARNELNSKNFYAGIEYMHDGNGEVYVTYNTDGGSSVSSGILNSNNITATSTKKGYYFGGWTLSNYNFSSDNYRVDLSLSAKWTINSYTVSVSSSNNSAGSVSISGTSSLSRSFDYGSLVTITATPSTGYTFYAWYQGYSKVSSNLSYTFSMPANSVSYEARWIINSYTVSVSSSDTSAGSVSISGTSSKSKSFDYNSSVTIIAKTNTGYTFDGWYNGSSKVSSNSSYTFSMPANSVSYEAKWTINSYTVSVSSSNEYRGTVAGEGNYKYGSSVTIVATPKANCYFDGWYKNDSFVSSSKSYTFTLGTDDVYYVAKFSSDDFAVTITNENSEYGFITGGGQFGVGDSVTITATAYFGYSFVGWYNGSTMVSSSSSYTFIMGSSDITLKATWSYSDDFEFSDNGDGTITLTGLKNKTMTDVIIPSKYYGKTVTTIGECAFSDCSTLTSITIPDSVTTIGYRAFYNCRKLESVMLSNSLTILEGDLFYNCSSLKSVNIPTSVVTIQYSAFYACQSLKEIYIPSSVTTVGFAAFNGCNSSFIIYCQTSSKPANWDSDWNCNHNVVWGVSMVDKKEYNDLYYCICDNSYVTIVGCNVTATDLIIPSTIDGLPVLKISNMAFSENRTIESISIPDSVTEIGTYVFFQCYRLTIYCSMTNKPDTWIEKWNCDRPYVFGYNGTKGTYNGFKYAVTQYGGIDTIIITGYETGITDLTIPTTISGISNIVISDSAFRDCGTLTNVSLSSSVKSIGNYAFSSCSNLRTFTMNNGITIIGEYAFSYCSELTSITIPDSVTTIGQYAFYLCRKLESVMLSNSLTILEGDLFYNCSSLKSVNIPTSVVKIKGFAFAGCSSLEEIYIPTSVTSMDSDVFWNGNSSLIIYCQASSEPSSWESSWNSGHNTVWGYHIQNI